MAYLAVVGDSPTTPSIPSPGTFPLSKSGCPYYIHGLAPAVVDPSSSSLEARLVVGDAAYIILASCPGSGADGPYDFTFAITGVLAFLQDGVPLDPGGRGSGGLLQASTPGQTSITMDFKGDDGKRYGTTLGYCPEDNYCGTPRPIDVVRVVAK